MSRTRNQRRRDNRFEKIFCAIMFIGLILLTIVLLRQCRDINELQEKLNANSATIMRADSYLPDYYDRSAYEAAVQRYNIENGFVIPEQKETAPEAATSEADRCKGAS